MSHFTTVATQVNDLVCLAEALDDLKLEYSREDLTVRGWRGNRETADMVIRTGGSYDIGVRRLKNGFYEFVADWWGVETTKGVSEDEFKNSLSQRYQYHNVKQACEEKGYAVEEEVNEEDGSIRLVVRKWVSG